MSYDYYDKLSGVDKARYDRKLQLIDLSECPYRLPAGCWEDDPTKWPEVEWGDIYTYLIESPGIYTKETMKNYKGLEGHKFFKSGWVQTIFSYKPDNSTMTVLKCDVRPSWRVNDEVHHPWVAVTSDGTISCAHCDCTAGLGESCSHVGAILYKVEAAVRLGYTKTACTDQPCQWNNDFVKNIRAAPISKISFYKETSVNRVKKRKYEESKPIEKATVEEQKSLLTALSKCRSKPVVLSTFHGHSEPFHWKKKPPQTPKLPPSLRSLYQDDVDRNELTDNMIDSALRKVDTSCEQRQFICNSSKEQANSLVWREQRIGRITSSNVHRVLHTDPVKPSKSLILSICTESRDINTAAIKWGKDNESSAIKDYSRIMKERHSDVTVQKSGLLISESYSFIGASADSVSSCACHGKRVVEVKCPFTHRGSSVKEYLDHKSQCIGTSPNFHLKENHSYYAQVQLQLMVHNVEIGDFVIWTPKFIILIHVPRNDVFIQNMIDQVVPFYRRHIIPELLTRHLEKSPKSPQATKENAAPKLYCFCQQTESGRMIGCDNKDCRYQWFHMSCVKLKRGPKHSWFCKDCKKKQSRK